jgi:acetolactate synthase I/II/III large subunit
MRADDSQDPIVAQEPSTATQAGKARVPNVVAEPAEAYLEALTAQGVDWLFLNPGTDTFPVQEAAAKLLALRQPTPRVVLCPFETVALAAAHGFYAAAGRPQAVLVHVDVGTQNLGSMVHNAQRGRAAVLISAGRAPYTTDPRQRGARDDYIHWFQEQFDQHGIVRNYVKWDYELRRPDQVGEVVARAFQIASSDPPGPVYLTLPREVLMSSPGTVQLHRPERFPPTKLGAGDPEQLQEVARRLVQSERAVVLTAASGRSRAGFDGLIRLAELMALPVVEWRDRVNFPAAHPLHQGYSYTVDPLLESADLILVLDHDVPYIPTRAELSSTATIVQIDLDPIKEDIPLWSFPLDLAIKADTGRALGFLADVAAELLAKADRRRIDTRHDELAASHARLRADWKRSALGQSRRRPIAPDWLAYCLDALYREAPEIVFVDESVTNRFALFRQIGSTGFGSWFQSGGSGLGWGLGAAVGAKLAHPDRPVIALVGDGAFIFGAPLAALWTAQAGGAPILVVILNNGGYDATRQPLAAAYPEGYSVRTSQFVGTELTPSPRYDVFASSVGAYGERVEDPIEVLPALRRGLERVRDGQSAILDVILMRPSR